MEGDNDQHTIGTKTSEKVRVYIYLRKFPEGHIFTGDIYIFCHKVFFRMYFPPTLEVFNSLFIDSVGLM